MALSLSDLLRRMLEMGGSDLHITTNSPPQIRVHGHLVPLDLPQLTPAETKQLAYSVMTDSQKHRFEESLELDFSFGLKGLARFRANVFNQRGASAVELKKKAIERGMITLRRSGLIKVAQGWTTLEEVARETIH